jgi:hypothetical protein
LQKNFIVCFLPEGFLVKITPSTVGTIIIKEIPNIIPAAMSKRFVEIVDKTDLKSKC